MHRSHFSRPTSARRWRCCAARIATRRACTGSAARAFAFADSPAGASVHHVDYRELVADPLASVRNIQAALGLDFNDAHAAILQNFVAANRQHKHGQNPYSLAEFGLDSERLQAEHRPYIDRFL